MPASQPITVAEQIFAKLQNHLNGNTTPTQFELAALNREVNKLAQVDAADASIARAGLAALTWNFDEVYRWVGNAVANSRSETTYLNAALTLRYVNRYEESLEYSRNAFSASPNSSDAAEQYLQTLVMVGHPTEALEIANDCLKRGLSCVDTLKKIRDTAESLIANRTDERRLQAELGLAFDVLISKRQRCEGINYEIDQTGTQCVVANVIVVGSIEVELELDELLAVRLCDFQDWDPSVLRVQFRYQEEHELQPG